MEINELIKKMVAECYDNAKDWNRNFSVKNYAGGVKTKFMDYIKKNNITPEISDEKIKKIIKSEIIKKIDEDEQKAKITEIREKIKGGEEQEKIADIQQTLESEEQSVEIPKPDSSFEENEIDEEIFEEIDEAKDDLFNLINEDYKGYKTPLIKQINLFFFYFDSFKRFFIKEGITNVDIYTKMKETFNQLYDLMEEEWDDELMEKTKKLIEVAETFLIQFDKGAQYDSDVQ